MFIVIFLCYAILVFKDQENCYRSPFLRYKKLVKFLHCNMALFTILTAYLLSQNSKVTVG